MLQGGGGQWSMVKYHIFTFFWDPSLMIWLGGMLLQRHTVFAWSILNSLSADDLNTFLCVTIWTTPQVMWHSLLFHKFSIGIICVMPVLYSTDNLYDRGVPHLIRCPVTLGMWYTSTAWILTELQHDVTTTIKYTETHKNFSLKTVKLVGH